MKYSVKTIRSAGLEARWGRLRTGAPAIFIRDPQGRSEHQKKTWWLVSADMWSDMHKKGVREAFDCHTLLADVFSIHA